MRGGLMTRAEWTEELKIILDLIGFDVPFDWDQWESYFADDLTPAQAVRDESALAGLDAA